MRVRALQTGAILFAGSMLLTSSGRAEETSSAAPLPPAVATAFEKAFPKGRITEASVETENGVTVYDIEFRQHGTAKETDIAADGTLLESSMVVHTRSVPRAAMQAVRRAERGARIHRIERVEIRCETKDGAVVTLASPVTRYEMALQKGRQEAEIVVGEDGTVVEPAEWRDAAAGEGKDARPR